MQIDVADDTVVLTACEEIEVTLHQPLLDSCIKKDATLQRGFIYTPRPSLPCITVQCNKGRMRFRLPDTQHLPWLDLGNVFTDRAGNLYRLIQRDDRFILQCLAQQKSSG